MLAQDQIFIPRHPGPRIVAGLCSAAAHVALLALLVFFYRNFGPTIIQEKSSRATQIVSSRSYLAFNSSKPKSNKPSILPAHAHQPRKQVPKAEVAADSNGDSVEVIRQKAIKTTAALVQNFKFRITYGVRSDEYSLAVQTGGAPPQISADDLPPRFEQYLVVEATISIDGNVVDARLITGIVDQKIQNRVLAAIREYKYIPAKHNGSPIPSQIDIVIHVPS